MSPPGTQGRPEGPDQVRRALIDATIELIVQDGPGVSVRRIAAAAGVNHGLVHTYFGSKPALITAALDEVNRRAVAEVGPDGYPPADLAQRRGGELARVLARVSLDVGQDLFSSHPILASWQDAVRRDHLELDDTAVAEAIACAASIALGWAVFGGHLRAGLGLDDDADLDGAIAAATVRLGLIPKGEPPAVN